ncbi:hypothetical protein WJX74_005291 [Apatococcus lobatus]|uniref:F-box domain-containing protein n=1 Tax=Apatococcus lobatus TaxID=904363 RepID=A0AAW1S671_9CHLO
MTDGGLRNLLDLPEGCLIHTLSFLSRRDLAAAAQSCRTFSSLALSSVIWLRRLREDLDLPLQAAHARDWREDYIRLINPLGSQQPLRFLGSFTDGGVDDEHNQYWVDNLFTQNYWEAYCSKEGKGNINCLGVLLDKGKEVEQKSREHRDLLIRRLKYPLQVLAGFGGAVEPETANIDRYSTEDLEHLLHDVLWHELQQNTMLGQTMLATPTDPAASVAIARAELERAMAIIVSKRKAPLQGQCYVPEEPIHLLDRTLPMAMQQHAQKHGISLGVVEQLKICRAGAFSCPVACGVVLLGKVDLTHLQDLPPADLQKTLQAVVEQQACCAFDDVTSIHSLLDRCHKGQLPAISHHEANATGEWAEFQPEPRSVVQSTDCSCTAPFPDHLRKLHRFNMAQGPAQAQPRQHANHAPQGQASQQPQGLAALLNEPSSSALHQSPFGTPSCHQSAVDSAAAPRPSMPCEGFEDRSSSVSGKEAGPAAAEAGTCAGRQVVCQLEPAVWFRFRCKEEAAEHRRQLARRDCEAALQNGWAGDTVQMSAAAISEPEEDDLAGPAADAAEEFDAVRQSNYRTPSPRNTLQVQLQDRRSANVLCIKLISHEDRMHEWHDEHDCANIDMNHVQCIGKLVDMPLGVQLSSCRSELSSNKLGLS